MELSSSEEVGRLDNVLVFGGAAQPSFRDRVGDPRYRRRAIGVFSYTGVEFAPADADDPMFCFRRFGASRGGVRFQVVAVWTAPDDEKERDYWQAHEGMELHGDWIGELPTVMLGDFNANASYKGDAWPRLESLLERRGLVRAYHTFFGEPFGAESRPTHFHQGKPDSPFHLDYCFLPEDWAGRISDVEVGSYERWHEVSDHAPLIVDLEMP